MNSLDLPPLRTTRGSSDLRAACAGAALAGAALPAAALAQLCSCATSSRGLAGAAAGSRLKSAQGRMLTLQFVADGEPQCMQPDKAVGGVGTKLRSSSDEL